MRPVGAGVPWSGAGLAGGRRVEPVIALTCCIARGVASMRFAGAAGNNGCAGRERPLSKEPNHDLAIVLPPRVEDYYGFGADVLAVADGTVVFTQDGVPEQTPSTVLPADKQADIRGNKVVVKIAPRVFAVYEHLQPGSLTVKVGDVVKAGAVLAKLGNTGPSTVHTCISDSWTGPTSSPDGACRSSSTGSPWPAPWTSRPQKVTPWRSGRSRGTCVWPIRSGGASRTLATRRPPATRSRGHGTGRGRRGRTGTLQRRFCNWYQRARDSRPARRLSRRLWERWQSIGRGTLNRPLALARLQRSMTRGPGRGRGSP